MPGTNLSPRWPSPRPSWRGRPSPAGWSRSRHLANAFELPFSSRSPTLPRLPTPRERRWENWSQPGQVVNIVPGDSAQRRRGDLDGARVRLCQLRRDLPGCHGHCVTSPKFWPVPIFSSKIRLTHTKICYPKTFWYRYLGKKTKIIWKTRRCASCKNINHWLTDNLKSRDASASKNLHFGRNRLF